MLILYYDQIGSLRLVADELGNAVKEVVYDSFGNILEDTNPALRIPMGFAGGLHDPDTGLVRFGYRDYDPDTGRFTALDPLGNAGGDSDLYGYCLDDPVNLVDPSGLQAAFLIRPFVNMIDMKLDKAQEIANEELQKRNTGAHNNEIDAMRHAEWSKRMSEEIDPVTSWLVGTGHEVVGILKGQPWDEAMMDIHNNAEGRDAASEGRDIDIDKLRKSPDQGSKINPYSEEKYIIE